MKFVSIVEQLVTIINNITMNKPELKTVYIKSNIQPKEYYEGIANKTLRPLFLQDETNLSKFVMEEKSLLTFTPEEYNQHIKDIIKETLDNAADKAELHYFTTDINKESIINTFEDTFNKLKYE